MQTFLLVISIILAIFAGVAFYYLKNTIIGLIAFALAAACFLVYKKNKDTK